MKGINRAYNIKIKPDGWIGISTKRDDCFISESDLDFISKVINIKDKLVECLLDNDMFEYD